ncbi:MAG TPA: SDR family NAD(P)-dependent oxidoreductase [Myxococcota bacterium]|nr:SDR family NAD(P)-dependent oxidoreductase [Myxococcota bacterium]
MAHALITGGTEGIGLAFARALAAEGYTLTLVARRAARLAAVSESLPGGPHAAVTADLSTEEGLSVVVDALRDRPPTLLVNNAGAGCYGAFHFGTWSEQGSLWRLNAEALATLAHVFLAGARPGDALINVSSILGFLPQPTSAMYSATKAFVTALSEALWYENRKRGVYVMGLHPGITHTSFRSRAGGSRSPAFWAASPEAVVARALRALRRRRQPTVVFGGFNHLLAALPRLFPRQLLIRILGATRSKRRGDA